MTLALDPAERVRQLVPAWPAGVRVEVDGDELRAFLARDMLHLDADALHDRLHHWTLTRLARALPAATAGVSFARASPADPHTEASLDAQEVWRGLEPTLALDLPRAREGDLERFASLVEEFVEVVEKSGRPEGFRSPEVGTME